MIYQTIILKDGSEYHNVQMVKNAENNVVNLHIGYSRITRIVPVCANSIKDMKFQTEYMRVEK